ncbi:hypothetical protein EUX98_g7287 [Antrodiella citrinella]|uniref:Cytochrome P450 n=1 Tax=Antrodiella citrinella TaxID=2447956 RepID=A0A4S4MNL7_9APHY|nr:hypothetical protein EUX98_g7287 [Antrodiella citrinella]
MCDAVCSELRDGPQNLDFFELTGRISLEILAPHFKYLGSPAFRRKLVKMSPLPDLRKFADLIDILHDQSKQILEMKKTLLKNGDETLLKRVGEGKDILSVLLKANLNAAGDGLSEDELLAQMSYVA